MGFLGEILYMHTVVGNDTYSVYTKMGARIHRTVALRMRTDAYTIVEIRTRRSSGDQFFYPSNRNLRFRCEMR